MTRTSLVFLILLLAQTVSAQGPKAGRQKVNGPLAPKDSLRHLKLAPGLKLQLIAHEPQVVDPVAIAFDEDLRLWVVEMSDYPNGPTKKGQPPRSRVRILEDLDRDGVYETSKVFVDKLLFATGLQLWQGGAFVTLAGKVMYFKDSDGDGRADIRRLYYTGFAERNQQLRANHPTFGLDNRIYIANGLRGGTIVGHVAGKKGKPVSITGRDFRFNPRDGSYEAISGQGQFGLTFDDYGNRFVCSNRNPMKHIVLSSRYIKRNSFLALPSLANDICPSGAAATVYPLSRNFTHLSGHAGQITSACGIHYFRGTAMGSAYQDAMFVCEPAGNLIHRRAVVSSGGTFRATRVRQGAEFLASPDDWFRPVNLTTGPDGALYVVDMYRAIIEHPHWLPAALAAKLPLQDGDDRGRLYRVSDPKTKQPRPVKLSTMDSRQLVEQFEHPNAWQRTTAARLIYQRQDKSAVPHLKTKVTDGKSALARLHALWALDGLKEVTVRVLQQALRDPSARVREHAILLTEPRLKESKLLRLAVQQHAKDRDARVRMQVALSLGEAPIDESSLAALRQIAENKSTDSWTVYSILSSLGSKSGEFLGSLLAKPTVSGQRNAHIGQVARLLAEEVGARRHPRMTRLISEICQWEQPTEKTVELQIALITGFTRGVARTGKQLSTEIGIGASGELFAWMKGISRGLRNQRRTSARQAQFFRLAQLMNFRAGADDFLHILKNPKATQDLRVQAMNLLRSSKVKGLGKLLLADFNSQTPPVRQARVSVLLADVARAKLLLAALAKRKIAISELSPSDVKRLVEHRDKSIQSQAKKVLAAAVPKERRVVLAKYQAALKLKGRAVEGRKVFRKNCATCHQIHGIGVKVGPYIGDFSLRRKPTVVLESILNPNRAIDANYVSYTVLRKSGVTLTGLIASETPTSITLKQAENKVMTILRSDIQLLRSNRISLMPEGLEKNISLQQMADLLAFLRDWRFTNDLVPSGKR